MRTIKMLGLATTAALMAMALLGASSASAGDTALCESNPEPGLACPANDQIEHIHEATLTGLANRATLLTPLGNIRCHVLFLGDTVGGTLGRPLVISGVFTYFECNLACDVVQVSATVTVLVLKTGLNTARITGEGEVLVNCPALELHCIYNGEGLVSHGLGSGTATELNGEAKIFNQTVNPVSPVLEKCPPIAKLDIVMTPLIKTWITS